MNKCEHCGKEFEAKRADARFCSVSCRKKNNRTININVTGLKVELSVPFVTDKSDIVTDNRVTDKTGVTGKLPIYKQSPHLYYQGEITPEVSRVLEEVYKQYEKENKGFKCQPYTHKGKQILTLWERSKLLQRGIKDSEGEVSGEFVPDEIPGQIAESFLPEFTPGYCVKCRKKAEVKVVEYDDADGNSFSEALCKKHVEELQKFLTK